MAASISIKEGLIFYDAFEDVDENSLMTAAVARVVVRARRLMVTGVALMPRGV